MLMENWLFFLSFHKIFQHDLNGPRECSWNFYEENEMPATWQLGNFLWSFHFSKVGT